MDDLTLIYREDPATGLPRLEVPSGSLDTADLQTLQQQLHQRYQQLVGTAEGQVIALNGSLSAQVPRHYRVSVQWQNGKRCPTLLLRAVEREKLVREEGNPLVDVDNPGSWPVQLFGELAELLDGEETAGRRSALDFVLADLRAVWKKNPRALTLLLLAGYLHAADAICRRHGAPLDNKYVEAAHLLSGRGQDILPDGALDPLLEKPA